MGCAPTKKELIMADDSKKLHIVRSERDRLVGELEKAHSRLDVALAAKAVADGLAVRQTLQIEQLTAEIEALRKRGESGGE